MKISSGFGGSLKKQFEVRCRDFDVSANWITDKQLLRVEMDLAGEPSGEALDLCCGTGQNGRALKARGWSVKGVDICDHMVETASQYFPVSVGAAEKIPFKDNSFGLVVCRQTFQFLNVKEALSEIARVLAPGGRFILSQTVPFSEVDKDWLYEIHRVKQALLLTFYTVQGLIDELTNAKFIVEERRSLTVRESITQWMRYAPELSRDVKDKVLSMIKDAPADYKKLHRCEVVNGEVFEDWHWVVLKASFKKA